MKPAFSGGFFVLLCSILLSGSGCRYGALGPTRIPAPPTYSIGQNPYYNPNSNAGAVNPGNAAPTPATPSGWLPTGNQATPTMPTSTNPANGGNGAQFDLSNTTLPPARSTGPETAASNLANVSTRMSTLVGNDPSRLPVSDATGVRAPVQFQTPQWNAGVAATEFQNGQPMVNPASPNPATQPQTFLGNPRFVGGPVQYRGQPTFSRPNQPPTVLAESTVRADPNSRNYQSGWRDREPGSEIMR